MKFTASASHLLKNLSVLNSAIPSNPVIPILENFLFQLDKTTLTVVASDIQSTIVTEIDVESSDSGQIAVPAKLLIETLKSLGDQPVNFSADLETFAAELLTSNGRFKLAGENPLDFPKIPQGNKAYSIEVESDVLTTAIANTIYASSSDELRPAMGGVYLQLSPEEAVFVATDGHRLIKYTRKDIKAESTNNCIIPKKALNMIKAALPSYNKPVSIDFNNQNAFFSFNSVRVICRLIDERYPDYENVIPRVNPNKLVIDRLEFLNSLKRIFIYSNKATHQVRLKITGDNLTISTEDLDYSNEAVEKLPCEYAGEDMEIGFNGKFLLEMVTNSTAKTLQIDMSGPSRAGIMSPTEQEEYEDILMLVMPVMLNNYGS